MIGDPVGVGCAWGDEREAASDRGRRVGREHRAGVREGGRERKREYASRAGHGSVKMASDLVTDGERKKKK